MNVVMVASGGGLMVAAVAGYYWGIPKNGETNRVPDKWGLGVVFPILVMVGAIGGIVLAVKGFYP
jgi:hypothetical protein